MYFLASSPGPGVEVLAPEQQFATAAAPGRAQLAALHQPADRAALLEPQVGGGLFAG
jgi:hypothetical protein